MIFCIMFYSFLWFNNLFAMQRTLCIFVIPHSRPYVLKERLLLQVQFIRRWCKVCIRECYLSIWLSMVTWLDFVLSLDYVCIMELNFQLMVFLVLFYQWNVSYLNMKENKPYEPSVNPKIYKPTWNVNQEFRTWVRHSRVLSGTCMRMCNREATCIFSVLMFCAALNFKSNNYRRWKTFLILDFAV